MSTQDEPAPWHDEPIEEEEGGALLGTIGALIESKGHKYTLLTAESLTYAITAKHGVYRISFDARDSTSIVRMICGFGSHVPVDRRMAIAEAMTRINARIYMGNFDLDFADGEMRFRQGMDVENGVLSETMVDNMIGLALYFMDMYHETLMRVAFGDADPELAVAAVL